MNTNTNAIGLSLKKKALIALCALVAVVAIVVTTVMATVAYLAASSSVSNVFTVGNIAIMMDEAAVNPDGTLMDGGVTRRDTNTYHLVPDGHYIKDPKIHVAEGSEPAYLFITVKNDIAAIAANTPERPSIASQLAANGWAKIDFIQGVGDVYVYVGFTGEGDDKVSNVGAGGNINGALDSEDTEVELSQGGQSYSIFETFSVSKDADCNGYGAAKITINGFAIQDTGLNTVQAAYDAVRAKFAYIFNPTTTGTV